MHLALSRQDHRPWPIPEQRWTWRQSWQDLLFAHWPISAKELRPFVPAELEIEEFGGSSWIGVVPFRMTGVMRRGLPDLPWVSAFPELNVRLYVQHGGKPGVWFLSLDASNPLAVWAARRFFHLPYYRAQMALRRDGADYVYASHRPGAEFKGRYRPCSGLEPAAPGTLEHWLTERYCLYARDPHGTLWRNEVHHLPWPLQRAEMEIERNTFFDFHGLAQPTSAPILHFAERIDVVVWSGERLSP
ncbi:MAG: DUF2071 domain-containing protein [Pseudomonadota bacterium]